MALFPSLAHRGALSGCWAQITNADGVLEDGIVLLDSAGNYLLDSDGHVLYAADEIFLMADGSAFGTADGALYGVTA